MPDPDPITEKVTPVATIRDRHLDFAFVGKRG